MQTFTMYIGLSGSGKSTLAENQLIYKTTELNRKVAYLSSDEIRKELFGDENDQSHNVKVFEEMFKRTRRALIEGEDVIYDATNLSSKRRRNF